MIKFLLFFGIAIILLLPVMLTIGSALLYGLWRAMTYETRFRKFFAKYGNNDEIARMIASGKIWTGQTSDQLRDAKGAPSRITHSGTHETWFYEGKTLMPKAMQVSLEDDRVRTWS